MILFIFNNKFPEQSGFGLRCKRAIDTLSELDEVQIMCRGNDKNRHYYLNKKGKHLIHIFKPISPINDLAKNYIAGLYEIIRNIDLMFQLGSTCISTFYKNRSKEIKIYVVNSPLTVPLIVFIVSKFFKVSLEVVEFHDLEPELALHIKHISKKNMIYKVEVLLEKLICKTFNKIIVTTNTQSERISKRTGKDIKHILVIPNTVDESKKSLVDRNNEFSIGYFSSFNYSYSTEGIKKIINKFNKVISQIPNLKLYIVGNGIELNSIRDSIEKNNLSEHVIIVKEDNKNAHYLAKMDLCIIPWEQDEMTETMLPTKLFQYMAAKKVILAPNFGEFKSVLKHYIDSILYDSYEEIDKYINELSINTNLRQRLESHIYKKYIKFYHPKLFKKKLLNFMD